MKIMKTALGLVLCTALGLGLCACSGSMAKRTCTSTEDDMTCIYEFRAKSENDPVDSIVEIMKVPDKEVQEEFGLSDDVMNAKNGQGAADMIKGMLTSLTGYDDIEVTRKNGEFIIKVILDPDELGEGMTLSELEEGVEAEGFTCE